MKKFRAFQCESGEVIEKYVHDHVSTLTCACGKSMKRIVSAPRYFSNTTGRSPSANYSKPR